MFSFFRKKLKMVVHNGNFHSDDVFSCAAVSLWASKNNYSLRIIRTRDSEIIKRADFVADVGGIYDPATDRFDHHQKNGAGVRKNGIPYASFGLIWKKYGEQICNSREVADMIENRVVIPVDARDNGVNISTPKYFGLSDYRTSEAIYSLNITRQENKDSSHKQFKLALCFAKEFLKREIIWAKVKIDGEKFTLQIIENQNKPEILILDEGIEWDEAVSKNKEVKFVIYPRNNKQEWCVKTGRDDLEDYNSNRANMPKSWWGMEGDALVRESGVKGSIFCANGGWFAVAETKEGAVELAKKALQISSN